MERRCDYYPPHHLCEIHDVNDARCIRSKGHDGRHVFRSVNGSLVAWEPDWDCACCSPEDSSSDRCADFTYGVSSTDFPDIIA